MMRRKKLLLINPFNTWTKGIKYDPRTVPTPLSLSMVAALTPPHWDVEIMDENIQDFEMKEADLVGVTALTSTAFRSYEIIEMYCKAGIKTVIGGIHASMMPQEAAQYADVVVTGEAESIWSEVIHDFEHNELKKIYNGKLLPMEHSPIPRRDLLHPDYDYAVIQTTRGCPMQCEFCSVHYFNGRHYRARPVSEVLDEIEQIPQQKLNIIDDNLIGYNKKSRERAVELFKGMIDRGIEKDWVCQTSINFAEDEEVLKYAGKSGCRLALIGIESEAVEQLQESNKKLNIKAGVKNYEKIFDKIHQYGIAVIGTFMYGFDEDTPESMERRTDFIINSNIDAAQASIYTPLPGTGLYKRFEKDNRLLYTNYPEDWQKYHCLETVIRPKNMTAEELEERMYSNWERMYDKKVLYRKMLRSIRETKNIRSSIWGFASNIERHNVVFGPHDKPQYDYNEMLHGMNIPA